LGIRLINNVLKGGSHARVITVSAPFWFVNKTSLPIMIKETGYQATVAGVEADDDQVG
jgi:hypothetical protein